VPPRDAVEEKLAQIWCEVLRIEKAGIHDNFFDLGGHSLLATQLVSRIKLKMEAHIPLSRFFELPTIAELRGEIQQARANSATVLPARDPSRVLRGIEQLSAAEVDALLQKELAQAG
jgi:acyl carrier protein